MAFENVRMTTSNFSGDRTNGFFYTFDAADQLFKKKDKTSGALVASFPLNQIITTVYSLQFDGVFYWTLEKQTGGFTVRKWKIVSGYMVQQAIFSYAGQSYLKYKASSFAVEFYNDTLSGAVSAGASTVPVVDADIFVLGDKIVLGPSTASGFEGNYDTVTITGKVGNNLQVSPVLVSSYNSSDEVYTTRYFWVFNEHSPFNASTAALIRFNYSTGQLVDYSSSNMFSGVVASTFYNNRVQFIKGHEIISITPLTIQVFQRMVIDNLNIARAAPISTYALWEFSDVAYILQDRIVYYDPTPEEYVEETWSPQFNYVTASLVSAVYFVEVIVDPKIVHAESGAVPAPTSNVTITVLNQFRTPLTGRSVTLSATQGSLSPSSGSTDVNGQLTSTYTGNTFVGEVEITASAT